MREISCGFPPRKCLVGTSTGLSKGLVSFEFGIVILIFDTMKQLRSVGGFKFKNNKKKATIKFMDKLLKELDVAFPCHCTGSVHNGCMYTLPTIASYTGPYDREDGFLITFKNEPHEVIVINDDSQEADKPNVIIIDDDEGTETNNQTQEDIQTTTSEVIKSNIYSIKQ